MKSKIEQIGTLSELMFLYACNNSPEVQRIILYRPTETLCNVIMKSRGLKNKSKQYIMQWCI